MMKPFLNILAVTAFSLATTAAVAAEQTVVLKVGNLFCASCPFIVKRTLARIDGVKNVDVLYRTKLATVTYDDQKSSAAALASAVTEAGFPATPLTR